MTGIVFETATPFDTPQQMTELVAWLNQARELRRLQLLHSERSLVVTAIDLFKGSQRSFSSFSMSLNASVGLAAAAPCLPFPINAPSRFWPF
jgi:hypothetical protein